ncbi:MAG: DUF3418 domain-containing protein, partial [Actinobacteria bacterium]|nr:DUF3418 domain-containing protein [Actinomycetota bacterium]
PEDFDWAKVAPHLRPALAVVGSKGEVLAVAKSPSQLIEQLSPQFARALVEAASKTDLGWGPLAKRAATWEFGALPRVFEVDWQGRRLRGFPALVDEGTEVRVSMFADEVSQAAAMLAGTRRLVLLDLDRRAKLVTTFERLVDNRTRLALAALGGLSYRSARELASDVLASAVDRVVADNGGPAWDAESFEALLKALRRDLDRVARPALASAARISVELAHLQRRIDQLGGRTKQLSLSLADARRHLAGLGAGHFVSRAGLGGLGDLERYLAALGKRLEKLPSDPHRDAILTERIQGLERQFDKALSSSRRGAQAEGIEGLRPMLEELRVSFFAQSLGTKFPVSEERFLRALAERREAAGLA